MVMSLNFEAYYLEILNYFRANMNIAIAMGGVLFLLLLKKPKLFFAIALIVAINVSALYVISYTASVSDMQKHRLISKTTAQLEAY
jgi:hypothetical protein